LDTGRARCARVFAQTLTLRPSQVAQRKAAVVSRHAALQEQLGEGASVDASKGCVSSSRYALQPADLRSAASVEAAVAAAGVDRRCAAMRCDALRCGRTAKHRAHA